MTIGSAVRRRRSSLSSSGSTRSGRPLPDVEIRVRDDGNNFLAAGDVGEIIIRTPRIMKGYAGREDDAALADGWRATGDLGWVDEDGYVFFAGRKDDMIIRGGENIAPAEIETVLMSHPAVDEAAIIGIPSDEWGQTVKAFVVVKPNQKVSAHGFAGVLPHSAGEFQTPGADRVYRWAPQECARQNPAQGTSCARPGTGAALTARIHPRWRRRAKRSRRGALTVGKSRAAASRSEAGAGAVEVAIESGCAVATLSRRAAQNRVTAAMAGELMELAETVEDDSLDLRAGDHRAGFDVLRGLR